MPKPKFSKRESAPSGRITDSRFASFETDPRYQLPSKKNTKTKLDKRMSNLLHDDEFLSTAKVDRYGRKLKTDSKKIALQKLYDVEDSELESDSDSETAGLKDDPKAKAKKKGQQKKDEVEDDSEIDDDEVIQRELQAVEAKYDPARGGGFSSSELESDSDEEEEDEELEDETNVETRPGIRLRKEEQSIETGEVTNRIAIVNIDWDHIKSVDLMALFSSFVPSGGRIEKVSIYPSEFGKERIEREELEGPPREIFKKGKDEDHSDDSESESGSDDSDEDSDEEIKKELLQEGDDQDFDNDALRTYQLGRLRYYYAVTICSDTNTAHKIYEATDGSEYLSSSNFLDLRFIPDDVTFDDEPRDECDRVPQGYKPIEFVTDALQHSKVKLTWDMHPEEASRKEVIKNAFTGSRDDIAENDLKAYLASDSSDDEEEEVAIVEEEKEQEEGLSKKELARRKMREALGLSDEPAPKKSSKAAGPVGDMQITFTPALIEGESKKKKAEEGEEETTIEKYKRKEKERRERRMAERKAKKEGRTLEDKMEIEEEEPTPAPAPASAEDLGFDDPFFTTEAPALSKSAQRKEERLKKRADKEKEEKEKAAEKAKLELVMADGDGGAENLDHFDMKHIMKAEKLKKKKKGKKGKKDGEDLGDLQEDIKLDIDDDPRFKAMFESHEYALDPSNPKFVKTEGMKQILEVGRKKRKAASGDGDLPGEDKNERSNKKAKGGDDIDSLIKSVKRKAGKK
ncbi:hypothetical protein V8F06_008384 [Rhypophila decipiens]